MGLWYQNWYQAWPGTPNIYQAWTSSAGPQHTASGAGTPGLASGPRTHSKEVITHAAAWMNLEDRMLRETSPSQKGKYCMIPLFKYEVQFVDCSKLYFFLISKF